MAALIVCEGSVREVQEVSTGKMFAMKSINLDRIDKAQIKELQMEINLLRKLDHPNIIRIYEVYKSRTNINIIMELLTGGEVCSRVLKKESDIRTVVTQLLSACRYWHSQGIVHRDLKLENIMFQSKRGPLVIKVIDFGLGTVYLSDDSNSFGYKLLTKSFDTKQLLSPKKSPGLDSRKSFDKQDSRDSRGDREDSGRNSNVKNVISQRKRILMSTVGTAFYMAPEIISGSGYTNSCDVWAIGVITYMLVTRRAPFNGKGEKEIFQKVCAGRPKFTEKGWDNISPDAKVLVQKLLNKDPQARWTTAEALDSPWLKEKTGSNREIEVERDVVDSLQRFTSYSRIKKAALMVVAHKSTGDDLKQLNEAFLSIDRNRTGVITVDELRHILQKHGIEDEETQKLFDGLDQDKTGQIRYLEFLAATIETRAIINAAKLSDAFDHLDEDRSGFITEKNLKKLLGRSFSDREIKEIIEECDLTGDKRVSREEFMKLMLRGTGKVQDFAAKPPPPLTTVEEVKLDEGQDVTTANVEANTKSYEQPNSNGQTLDTKTTGDGKANEMETAEQKAGSAHVTENEQAITAS